MKTCDLSRLVILILGAALLTMVLGGGYMNYAGREVDPRYFEIITIIVMGLVALLKTGTTTEPTKSNPTPVEVMNNPANAVPVTEEPDGIS